MAKKFAIPFAATGDKAVIPDALQPDGSVSYTQGFGPDYELDRDLDPANAKDVPRDETNQLYFDITDAVGEVQRNGYALWSSDMGAYPLNARVYYADKVWRSNAANNTGEPGVAASWDDVSVISAASESISGISRLATQAEVDAGASNTTAVTPSKLRFGFSVSLSSNGYITFPSWMGDLILQWISGTTNASGGATAFNFPIAFPNACFGVTTSAYSSSSSLDGIEVSNRTKTPIGVAGVFATNNPVALQFDLFAIGH